MSRPLCICGYRPAAINYIKNNKTYYRKKCESCLKNGGEAVGVPKWYQSGYRKKLVCDKCSYKGRHQEQFNVFYIDGNLNNTKHTNLKTVCANCQRILHKEGVTWKQGDLRPDF